MDDANFNGLVDCIYDAVIAPEEHDHEVLQATGSHFMLVLGFSSRRTAPNASRFLEELSSRRLDGNVDYQAGASASDMTVAFVNANRRGGSFATDRNMSRDARAAHPYIKWNKHP